MKRLQKPIVLWLGALLAIAFALLYYEADLLWKVQEHNIFLDTSLFFKQTMALPGGMLSYLGAYFTQHFYHPWVGVVILCCWWLLLMWLTKHAFSIPNSRIVLTLIPVAILLATVMGMGYWVYMMKLRGYFFVPTIGVTAGTALLWAYRVLPEKLWQRAVFLFVVTLAGYPLMGAYALGAVSTMGVLTWRKGSKPSAVSHKLVLTATALLSVVIIPLLYYRYVYYETNIIDIYRTAIPSFAVFEKYPEYYTPYYVLVACFLLLAIIPPATPGAPVASPAPSKGHKPKNAMARESRNIKPWLIQGGMLVITAAAVFHFWYKDANFHHELRMQRCVEQADWDGVVEEGTKQDCEPTRAIVMMHNLALSRLGRQCAEMYRFRKGSRKPNAPMPIYMYNIAGRMMMYEYGAMNECHRICMEEGVEYNWNVEQLRYLARCAIFNNEVQAARKFLDLLRHTGYYGEWADRFEKLLYDPQLLASDKETGPITHIMHYEDNLDSVDGYVEKRLMTTLAQTDADDLYFQEQAVLGAMWTRDPTYFWPRFEHYVRLRGNQPVPRIFQEAAWLFGNLMGAQGLNEWILEKGVKESFYAFMKLMEQYRQSPTPNMRNYIYERFGTTYYFEYFFLKDITYY